MRDLDIFIKIALILFMILELTLIGVGVYWITTGFIIDSLFIVINLIALMINIHIYISILGENKK